MPATARSSRPTTGVETVVVIGSGAAAREAAALLAGDSWQVVRLDALSPDAAAEQLAGASVVIFDTTTSPDRPETTIGLFDEHCPEAATILLTGPGARWPEATGRWPARPRVPAPFSRESLLTVLDAALGYRNLLAENRILREELRSATRLEDWVGCSADAASVRAAITTTAFSEGAVLILGEPGTGRRLAAELVHRLGRLSSFAFVPRQVASLPQGERGTILAERRRAASEPGSQVLRARPGSVYLSGVERLGLADQSVLEDAVRRAPPFRLLASAAPDLAERVREGSFEARLARRLEASAIRIAPLRKRREDVPGLLLHFLSRACRGSGVGPWGVSSETVEAWSAHHWPGNTAELRMRIERAVDTAKLLRFDGTILPEGICPAPEGATPTPADLAARPLKEVLASIEKSIIERALRRARGNQKRAAAILRLNPTTLHEKMKRHGLLRRPNRKAPVPSAGGQRR